MKQIFYFLIMSALCFCLFNCNNKKQSTGLYEATHNADSVNFDIFIKEFSADESFQVEHINFPVEMFVPRNDEYNTKDTTLYVHKTDWDFINLSDSSKFPVKEKVFFNKMQYENGFAIVVKGIDCGIFITYYFEKQKKEDTWFLVKIEDTSI